MQTEELEIVKDIPADLKLAIATDAPDFEETILKRKALIKKADQFEEVTSVDDTPRMEEAKRLRLDLVKCRTRLEAIRKLAGESARKRVEAINEMFRGYREENEQIEDWLKESEEFGIRYEASRRAELTAERSKELMPYLVDPTLYKLGEMTEDQWQTTLLGIREAHRLAAESAAREEKERREREEADRAERLRLAEENALLREQQEAAAKERRAAQDKADQEQKKLLAKLDEERRQNAALEAEKRRAEEEIAAKERADKAAAAKAKRAPDKTKVMEVASALEYMLTQLPKVKSDEATNLMKWIEAEGAKFVGLIKAKAESL